MKRCRCSPRPSTRKRKLGRSSRATGTQQKNPVRWKVTGMSTSSTLTGLPAVLSIEQPRNVPTPATSDPPEKKADWETAKRVLAEIHRKAPVMLAQGVIIGGI